VGAGHARHHQHLHVVLGENVEGVGQPGVEEGRVAGLQRRSLGAEREPQPPLQQVQPFLAAVLVVVVLRVHPIGGKDDLDRRQPRRPRLGHERLEAHRRAVVERGRGAPDHRPRLRLVRLRDQLVEGDAEAEGQPEQTVQGGLPVPGLQP